jgi:hypothetical protein
MLDKLFNGMNKIGWKGLESFDKKELVGFHLKELEDMFYELEEQNKENDSLGFITDLIRVMLKGEN